MGQIKNTLRNQMMRQVKRLPMKLKLFGYGILCSVSAILAQAAETFPILSVAESSDVLKVRYSNAGPGSVRLIAKKSIPNDAVVVDLLLQPTGPKVILLTVSAPMLVPVERGDEISVVLNSNGAPLVDDQVKIDWIKLENSKQNANKLIKVTIDPGAIQPESALPEDWYRKAVMYHVYVRTFKDSNNDGHGDIRGLINKLDYLKDLGISGIMLLPIMESWDREHGYSIVDFRDIEDEYGSLEDIDELLHEAHRRGIGVLMDITPNCTSAAHWLYQAAIQNEDSPFRNYYRLVKEKPFEHKFWRPEERIDGFRWGKGPNNVDLNFRNEGVQQFVLDYIIFWLNRGVDGFRFDSAFALVENGKNWISQPETHEIFRFFRSCLDLYENRFATGEVKGLYEGLNYLGDGTNEFHSAWTFGLQEKILGPISNGLGVAELQDTLVEFNKRMSMLSPDAALAPFLSNHDLGFGARPATILNNNQRKLELAASLLLTLPGVPYIYYGEEIGMNGNVDLSDITSWRRPKLPWHNYTEVSRTPMQWSSAKYAGFSKSDDIFLKVNPNYREVNVAAQHDHPKSLSSYYRKLIGIRNITPALQMGTFRLVSTDAPDHVLAYVRETKSQRVLVVGNFSDRDQLVRIPIGEVHSAEGVQGLFGSEAILEVQNGELTVSLPAKILEAFLLGEARKQ